MSCSGHIGDSLESHTTAHGLGQDIEDIGAGSHEDPRYDFDEKSHPDQIDEELTVDTDLAQMFGDHYKEAVVDNPYHEVDEEISARMNQVNDPDIISPPVHMNSAHLDMVKLRAYTTDILTEIEKVSADKKSSGTSGFGEKEFDVVNRKVSKKYGVMFKKMDLYYMYCIICRETNVKPCDTIRGIFQTHSFRSQSGVIVYAVFTHPFFKYSANGKLQTFSCKYNCRFCPNMPGRPRSYVPGEPGNDRAHGLDYDVTKQVHSRANAYTASGHINDKAEVIVLGGTWHSYPLKYRRMFIALLYHAFNTVHGERDRPVKSMKEEIKLNETAKCRVIGLTIETRPDQITGAELVELREMGVTRVQLGIQHTNDRLLTRIQRRCTADDGIRAIKALKDNGFKVDIHIMPDLPKPFTDSFVIDNRSKLNSANLIFTKDDIDWSFDSVGEDRKMFEEIFHSDRYVPDQVKIYPCEVMDWTDIKKDFEEGTHVPYGTITPDQKTNPLIELLISAKADFPEECRINRLVRDIPEGYVLGGIKDAGGRQRIERMMKDRGLKCNCMRCREIKKKKVNPDDVALKITHFKASGGDEYFLQYVTAKNELVGFLRLRVSDDAGQHVTYRRDGSIRKKTVTFQEVVGVAMIRELHVYGEAVEVNRNKKPSVPTQDAGADPDVSAAFTRSQQHAGFGTRLLRNAFILSKLLGYKKMSVISGEGVKPYYRRFGFRDGQHFLLKDLLEENTDAYDADFTMEQIIHKVQRFGRSSDDQKVQDRMIIDTDTKTSHPVLTQTIDRDSARSTGSAESSGAIPSCITPSSRYSDEQIDENPTEPCGGFRLDIQMLPVIGIASIAVVLVAFASRLIF